MLRRTSLYRASQLFRSSYSKSPLLAAIPAISRSLGIVRANQPQLIFPQHGSFSTCPSLFSESAAAPDSKKASPRIRAVIFDVGGTIVEGINENLECMLLTSFGKQFFLIVLCYRIHVRTATTGLIWWSHLHNQ